MQRTLRCINQAVRSSTMPFQIRTAEVRQQILQYLKTITSRLSYGVLKKRVLFTDNRDQLLKQMPKNHSTFYEKCVPTIAYIWIGGRIAIQYSQ